MAGLLVIFYIGYLAKPTSFMQLSLALYFICFFILGICYCEYKKPVDAFIRKYWIILTLVFVPLSVLLVFDGVLAAIVGVLGSIVVSVMIYDKCPDRLVKVSDLCYLIFLLAYFPQMFIRGPIAHRFPGINEYLLSALSFIFGLLIPLGIGLVFLELKKHGKIWKKLGILIGI